VVQQDVLDEIESDRLAVYAVWEPILKTDDEPSSRKAVILLPGKRVKHYWVHNQDVGELFQPAIDLAGEPAWDVYLVYEPGVKWTDDAPPKPGYFMHQLRGRLPDGRVLHGPMLRRQIEKRLDL